MSFTVVEWKDPEIAPVFPESLFQTRLAVAIGVFDGVHLGHQRLLDTVTKQKRGVPTVLTFVNNPASFTRPETYLGEISTFKQRLELFSNFGIELVIALHFSPRFSRLKGDSFLDLFLSYSPTVSHMVVGFDFHLGRGRDIHADEIRRLLEGRGIRVDIVPALTDNGEPISSSRIRHCIREGKLREAETLLGRPFEIQMNGRIHPEEISKTQLVPETGTYAGRFFSSGRTCDGRVEITDNHLRWDVPTLGWEKIQIFEEVDRNKE